MYEKASKDYADYSRLRNPAVYEPPGYSTSSDGLTVTPDYTHV